MVSDSQASAGLGRRCIDGPWRVLYWERGPGRDQRFAPSGLDCTRQSGKDCAALVVRQCLTKSARARFPFYREGGKRMFCVSLCLPLHPCVYLLLPENLTFFSLGRITFYSEPLAFLHIYIYIFFLNILWHCPSLGLERKLTFSSPVATGESSKFAGVLSAALSYSGIF